MENENPKRRPPNRVFVRIKVDGDACEGVECGILAYRATDTPVVIDDGGHYWAEYVLKRTGRLRDKWDVPPLSRIFVADKEKRR